MGKDSSMDDKWKAYTDKIGNFVGTLCGISYIALSYVEYLQLMQQLAGRASYLTYLQKGGLSELYNLPTVESEKQYVASVKDMILLRDISPFVI